MFKLYVDVTFVVAFVAASLAVLLVPDVKAAPTGFIYRNGATAFPRPVMWRVMQDKLIVRWAREHNLKNVSVELPRDKIIVFTGQSGSGKSSLAFVPCM